MKAPFHANHTLSGHYTVRSITGKDVQHLPPLTSSEANIAAIALNNAPHLHPDGYLTSRTATALARLAIRIPL